MKTQEQQSRFAGILIALIINGMLYGAPTSNESVNPFVDYSKSDGNVDIVTGNYFHTQLLHKLQGRNSMDFEIALVYSSNVYGNARAPSSGMYALGSVAATPLRNIETNIGNTEWRQK